MKNKEFKVDFIGIGAPRCGTSWVSRCLAEHPEVNFARGKELNFFNHDNNYQRGLKYYRSFFNNGDGRIRGEFSTYYYLGGETAAERIKRYFPRVKLIAILRHPVERAFSHYLYNKRKGKEDSRSFAEAIENNKAYVEGGRYYHYLSRFLRYFSRERIKIMFYDDSLINPGKFIREIYGFLGIDENFIPPSLNNRVNALENTNYRFVGINKLAGKSKVLKKSRIGRVMLRVLKFLRAGKAVNWILRRNRSGKKKEIEERIDQDTRARLSDVYRDDIHRLERFLKKDLSFWL